MAMVHPNWALKYKTKGTELRCIRGRYTLYRVSSVWDKEKGKSKKITHESIGTITETDGLIPKGASREKKQSKKNSIKNICVKEYGATATLEKLGAHILKQLESDFPMHWKELWALSTYRLLYQAPLKNMEFLLSESFFSEIHQDVDLSKNRLTFFIKEIGADRERILNFMKKFIDGSQHIVFDTTHLITQSKNIKMAHQGYNSEESYDPQVNLFYMFAVDAQMPVFYRLFPGNIHGIRALKLCLKESNITNAMVIGDKGFCSENNFEDLRLSGLDFIIPLKRNYALISYERLYSRDYSKAFEGHFFYQGRVVFFYTICCSAPTEKIVIFLDQRLKVEEETSYLKYIEDKREGFAMATYLEKQHTFGTISILTNMQEKSPADIYLFYKSRMEVEEVFDSYKNLLVADKTYMQSDDALNAWVFINHIAIMLYYTIFNIIKLNGMSSNLSPRDLMARLVRVNKIKINDNWHLAEINSKTQKILTKLNLPITCNLGS